MKAVLLCFLLYGADEECAQEGRRIDKKQSPAFRADDLALLQTASDSLGMDCQLPVEVHKPSAAGVLW